MYKLKDTIDIGSRLKLKSKIYMVIYSISLSKILYKRNPSTLFNKCQVKKINRFYRCAGCLIGALVFTFIGSVSVQEKQASWIQGIRLSERANLITAIYHYHEVVVVTFFNIVYYI